MGESVPNPADRGSRLGVAMGNVTEEEGPTATRVAVTTGSVGVGGGGIGLLVVWMLGYKHVDVSAEVGSVIGGFMVGAGSAIGTYGVLGCLRMLVWGKAGRQHRAAVRAARRNRP